MGRGSIGSRPLGVTAIWGSVNSSASSTSEKSTEATMSSCTSAGTSMGAWSFAAAGVSKELVPTKASTRSFRSLRVSMEARFYVMMAGAMQPELRMLNRLTS